MPWKPIDFQAITTLDKGLVQRLTAYLDEKERHLAREIFQSLHPIPSAKPKLALPRAKKIPLHEAVEGFSQAVQTISSEPEAFMAKGDWKITVQEINTALWYYVEVLESCTTELFQQLKIVGFDAWSKELFDVIYAIKELLLQRIDSLQWAIMRLEASLEELKFARKINFFDRIILFFNPLLDRSLKSALTRSEQYLKINSNNFFDRYREYQELIQQVDKSMRKFKKYQVLRNLDEEREVLFKKIYRMIKLWEKNQRLQALPEQESVRVLREVIHPDQAYELFREYLILLKKNLYRRSRSFKKNPKEMFQDQTGKSLIHEAISGYRQELHTLGATISKYRDFMLRTDPDPYIRSRWGFTEWIVAPEPKYAKRLLYLAYDAEKIDRLFEKMVSSFEEEDEERIPELNEQISRLLHDMGLPLTSKTLMRSKVDYLIEKMQELNELGSFSAEVVPLMGKILLKALRADWQYHVLFDHPEFPEIFEIHQGVVGEIDDRKHFDRINKFQSVIKEVTKWVKAHDTLRHVHEIELDIQDLKSYYQEFLAEVQRVSEDGSLNAQQKRPLFQLFEKEILEYRFLFGKFFHDLLQLSRDGKLMRNQFLFVDQYLETVEEILDESELPVL